MIFLKGVGWKEEEGGGEGREKPFLAHSPIPINYPICTASMSIYVGM